MLTWQIGAVKVSRIVEVEWERDPLRARGTPGKSYDHGRPVPLNPVRPFLADADPAALRAHPWLYPHFVTDEGALKLSVHALLVDAPNLRLVVDTCIGNDRPRAMLGGQALSTTFLSELEGAGWKRDEIDAVVCTHLHSDHVGWNTMREDGRWVPTFPKARYLIGKTEYDHWKAEGGEENQKILADSVQPIFDAGLVDFVAPDHRLSPEVRLVPTPGHTPGHVSVMIESEGQSALITGDALHHPCQIAHPDWATPFDTDRAKATITRRDLLEGVADAPILVIGTHFAAPTAGHVRREGQTYRFEV